MDFEDQLKSVIRSGENMPDQEQFISRLHHRRRQELLNRHRLFSGVSALVLLVMVTLLAISQLNDQPGYLPEEEYYSMMDEPDSVQIAEFLDEAVLYLLDQSDDIWSTLEFLTEIQYEPVTNLLEDKL